MLSIIVRLDVGHKNVMLINKMTIKQKLTAYITSFLLIVPLVAVAFISQPAQAYKCTEQTGNVDHYYRDGACYQPAENSCKDTPPPATGEECKNRDTSKDTRVANEKPVKNDGTAIDDWACATGTYNKTKHTCETCGAFGGCQTNANVIPTPKGSDTTVDPDTNQTNEDDENGSGSKAQNVAKEGECAGEKTDFLACDGDGQDALVSIIKIVITIVSIGVGIVAVGGFVYGAILYATAQDSQEQIRRSIVVVRGVGIGLVLYIFMAAIINFIVPGGVFSSAEQDKCVVPEEAADDQTADENNTNNNSNNSSNNQQNNTNNQNSSNNSNNDETTNADENADTKACTTDESSANDETNNDTSTSGSNSNNSNNSQNSNNSNNSSNNQQNNTNNNRNNNQRQTNPFGN